MPRKVEDDAVDALLNYSWPGNVRQLRHVVEKMVVDTLGGSVINADAVRRALDNHPNIGLCSADGRQPIAAYTEGDSLDDFLDRTMLDLYDLLRGKTGSHSQTARQFRIDRSSLYQRIERARRRLYLSTVKEAVASSCSASELSGSVRLSKKFIGAESSSLVIPEGFGSLWWDWLVMRLVGTFNWRASSAALRLRVSNSSAR